MFFFLLVLIASLFIYTKYLEDKSFQVTSEIKIKNGETYYSLMKKLNDKKIIANSNFDIRLILLANPKYKDIKKGIYLINKGEKLDSLFQKIDKSKQVTFTITFVEGKTFKDAINQIKENKNILLTLDYSKSIIDQITDKNNYSHSEGLIMPETYSFFQGDTDRIILKKAYKSLIAELDKAWDSRQKNLPYKNKYELLIMASIIEKESSKKSEKHIISSVFVNRLNKKMKLQTDPTIIYGLGDRYTGKITKSNIKEYTEYNTYRIPGLPPSPISLVSKSSLQAAANPSDNDYIYFVSKNDGSHFFSKTLKEHNEAVQKYQRNRKKSK